MCNYFKINHSSGMAGWWSPRIAAEVKWNRTANISGRFGGNLELDLINEFLNADFKGTQKYCSNTLSSHQFPEMFTQN